MTRADVGDWFELDRDSPYMLLVADVVDQQRLSRPTPDGVVGFGRMDYPHSKIPAVTHVDYSARVQTVHAETNPKYHALLECFREKTGCPVLLNTSFNVRGEPIVCTPADAFRCFMGTDIDCLAIGNYFLRKEDQCIRPDRSYVEAFEPD